jgi:hypothetical protein
MTPENFVYWLQGFFEITGGTPELTAEQIEMIKTHLSYVFAHKTAAPIPYAPGQTIISSFGSDTTTTDLSKMPLVTFC